mgnify:FL=1|tara:strand:- start:12 stop:596 length:585 start_codon:yes stop_codon:yes gene_type:complete
MLTELLSFNNFKMFDYISVIILAFTIFFSFYRGFVQSLLSLLTWIGAVILTLIFYETLSNFLTYYLNRVSFLEQSGLSSIISTILSIPFVFLASLIVLKKIRSMISADFQKSSLGNLLDKILGLIYGLVFGLLIITLLLIGIDKVTSKGFTNSTFIKDSILYKNLIEKIYVVIIKSSPAIFNEAAETIDENKNQ